MATITSLAAADNGSTSRSTINTNFTNLNNRTLDDLSDVTITSVASGEVLKWNGAAWINNTLAEAGIAASGANTDITSLSTMSFVGAVTMTVDNTDNYTALTINNNEATNNNPALRINIASGVDNTGSGLYIVNSAANALSQWISCGSATDGDAFYHTAGLVVDANALTTGHGLGVYSSSASFSGTGGVGALGLLFVTVASASASGACLGLYNAGSGVGIDLTGVTNEVFKTAGASVSTPGTLTKQVKVLDGATTYYMYLYTTGS